MTTFSRLDDLHEDLLMVPPPGYKFIPKSDNICGKGGCFECFDIYCERCEFKDRRIVELEMRNNDLVKYVTLLQGKMFGTRDDEKQTNSGVPPHSMRLPPTQQTTAAYPPTGVSKEPFGVIQSPILYDPAMNLSYVATTAFSPANKSNNKP